MNPKINEPDHCAGNDRRTAGAPALRWLPVSLVALMLAACGGTPVNQILLMPAPDVYEEGQIDPFIDNNPISEGGQPDILYATDRAPAEPDDRKFDFYSDARANVLRLGSAKIRLGDDEGAVTWEEARRISLLKNRTTDYPLEVVDIKEFGPLARTVRPLDEDLEADPAPGRAFAEAIDERLSGSSNKDVFIYVHGYKVPFENPVLVATELWHFLGYQGAFIAYSWPSTTKTLAYWSDLDDAANSARSLRGLVLHISENTDAEKIHVIGYSAGTRVVSRMLADLGMYGYLLDEDEIERHVRLGNVILVGSDVDRGILSGYLFDGALRVPDSLTIYQSSADSALGLSRFVFGRERSGQTLADADLAGEKTRRFFADNPALRLIDVTNAEAGTAGSGHSYFRESPWVSSDVLMTLLYDLPPGKRGLELDADGIPIWRFPPDYIARLRDALAEANPKLSEGLNRQ
jgi:esterase/lipase superfamily enzyme